MTEWLPIETYPISKGNGREWGPTTLLLVPTQHGKPEIVVGWFECDYWLATDPSTFCCCDICAAPTHWLPLPDALLFKAKRPGELSGKAKAWATRRARYGASGRKSS